MICYDDRQVALYRKKGSRVNRSAGSGCFRAKCMAVTVVTAWKYRYQRSLPISQRYRHGHRIHRLTPGSQVTHDLSWHAHAHRPHSPTLYMIENEIREIYMRLICCSDCSPIDFISDTTIQIVTEKIHTVIVTDGRDMAQGLQSTRASLRDRVPRALF
jgi:hypothetical protein